MDTLADKIDRRDPLAADSLCEEALTRFVREPDAMALAVVDSGLPVGVVGRDAFMARMEAPDGGQRPVRDFMDGAPVVAAADTPAAAFVQRLLREHPQALLSGFIVTDSAGRYLGVGTAVCLMAREGRRRASPRDTALIDRITAEVREPVLTALSVTDQLRRMRLPDGAGAYLDTITEAGGDVLALLETASDLQKAATGGLEINPQARRLQDLMDEVEARWRLRAEAAGVTMLVSYDGDPECVALLDSPRLMQVFDALIGHALAKARDGVIEASLQTRDLDGAVRISGRVRDNGALYTSDYLARLFAGAGATGEGERMADRLGLALAAHILKALGGSVTAEPNVGAGATITFEATLDRGGVAKAEKPELSQAARSAHILVVDDNATNRMVVEALCEMFDCSTESVADGVEAVEAARAGRFDVILMDIKMPRMDGVAATREIRKLKGEAGKAPIIALTANADPDDVREYLEAGMQAVVEKPIKPERLMEALDMALGGAPAGRDSAAA